MPRLRRRTCLLATIPGLLIFVVVVTLRFCGGNTDARERQKLGAHSIHDGPEASHLMRPALPSNKSDLVLEGRVVSVDGRPVKGAEVVVSTSSGVPLLSDDEGKWRILDRGDSEFSIYARYGEMASATLAISAATTGEIVLVLRPTFTFQARVIDRGSLAPLPGAEIKLPNLGLAQASDASGSAYFGNLPTGFTEFRVSAKGYADGYWVLDPREIGGEIATLPMDRGYVVQGSVRDSNGSVIPDAHVSYRRDDGRPTLANPLRTDSTGRWNTRLAEGNYEFFAQAGDRLVSEGKVVHLRSDTSSIDLIIGPGRRLKGLVTKASGEPTAAVVTATITAPPLVKRVESSVDGRFEIKGLTGEVRLRARAKDGNSGEEKASLSDDTSGSIITIVLSDTLSIKGEVRTSEGKPVVGALVGLMAINSPLDAGAVTTTSDSHGHFEFRGLASGEFVVRAGEGYSSESKEFWALSGVKVMSGEQALVLTVLGTGSIAGRVIVNGDEDGTAYALHVAGRSWSRSETAFSIDDIPATNHTLMITSPTATTKTVDEVRVVAGKVTDVGTITMSRGLTIIGRVLDRLGDPVAGAHVFASRWIVGTGATIDVQSGGSLLGGRAAVTNGAGRFELSGVEQESIVIAEHHGQKSVPVSVHDEKHIELHIGASGRIEGRVASGGKGGSGARAVGVTSQVHPSFRMLTSLAADGGFVFESIPPGKYTVAAISSYTPGTQAVFGTSTTVASERISKVILTPQRDGVSVKVRIESPDAPSSLVYLIAGAVSPKTGADIEREIANQSNVAYQFTMSSQEEVIFERGSAGPATACVLPIYEDPTDPAYALKIQRSALDLPVFCNTANLGSNNNMILVHIP